MGRKFIIDCSDTYHTTHEVSYLLLLLLEILHIVQISAFSLFHKIYCSIPFDCKATENVCSLDL